MGTNGELPDGEVADLGILPQKELSEPSRPLNEKSSLSVITFPIRGSISARWGL